MLLIHIILKREKKRKKGEGCINFLWLDRQMGPAGLKQLSLIFGSK